ncbi:MAG: phosphatase PAP2 family protein, partial [Acidimicrobiia bacterium]|nr:phosphatase PAP2 family protein [Acidimicrobiia bacterium]
MSATAAILITGVVAGAASYLIAQGKDQKREEPSGLSAPPRGNRDHLDSSPTRLAAPAATHKRGLLVPLGFGAIFGLSLLIGSVFDSIDENRGFARFDEWIAEWGSANATSLSTSLLKVFTELGGTAVVVTATLLTAAYVWRRHFNPQILWFLASVTIGQALINLGLKELINRERPDIDQLAPWAGSSFPSGHSAAAAATWAAIAFVLGLDRSTTTRALLAGAGGLIASSVAATRALLGVHWLTDVLAGVSLGWAWFAVCAIAFGGSNMQFGSLFAKTPDALPIALPSLLRAPLTMRGVTKRLLLRYTALIGLFASAGYVVVRLLDSTVVSDIDRRVSDWFVTVRTERRDMLTDWGSAFSDTVTIVIALVLVAGVLAVTFRRWLEPAFVVAAVVLETSVFVSAAWLVGRDRPQVEQLDLSPPTASFPSGHTAAAVAFYGALVILVWLHNSSRVARYAAAGLGTLIPLIVAVSRLYRGMHYLTDVVAGAVLGLLSLYLTLTAFGARSTSRRGSVIESNLHDGDPSAGRALPDRSRDSGRDSAPDNTRALTGLGSGSNLNYTDSVAVVANPVSAEEESATLRKSLEGAGVSPISWLETTAEDPGTGQSSTAVNEGADLVLAMGGDGTVRAVLEGLLSTGVPLGVIPSGTGNLLAG